MFIEKWSLEVRRSENEAVNEQRVVLMLNYQSALSAEYQIDFHLSADFFVRLEQMQKQKTLLMLKGIV